MSRLPEERETREKTNNIIIELRDKNENNLCSIHVIIKGHELQQSGEVNAGSDPLAHTAHSFMKRCEELEMCDETSSKHAVCTYASWLW